MAKIAWLDDQPWELAHYARALECSGHKVQLFESEEETLKALYSAERPDLLIQDLGRPVSYLLSDNGEIKTYNGFLEDAGWRFYDRFLRSGFPQIPVIICSHLGSDPTSRRISREYNVRLVKKDAFYQEVLVSAVDKALSATVTVIEASSELPLIVALDFDKVNAALVKHLAKNPLDLHRVSWGAFEELVERLLREMDYEVWRTPLTGDGGVDLWALQRSDLGEVLYAIDAKKYSPRRLVGPHLVRAIYGVTDLYHASVGMIITTSGFTRGARQLEMQYRHRISLKQFEDVVAWIKHIAGRGSAGEPLPAAEGLRQPEKVQPE
jgi:HJR/Mrr/RecB family endonuclease/CheY-like chemotaxis protein